MSATIFSNSGTEVKTLKDILSLNDAVKIITGTTDPTSVAVSAPKGSLYLNTSNGNIYKKQDAGSSTNWVRLSTGGEAGINYITNSDAEQNTTGWATYADAAGEAPVNGVSGAPTTTLTRTTSSALRGNGSFLITKDAADRQGEGASFDFTINNADKAKVLAISFDYEIASGTFASGDSSDLRVWIYDVTNSVLIPVSPYTIQGGGASQHQFRGIFQSNSNSTSYRLILHVATTSASAWTFKFDTVYVGPDTTKALLGAPISDWKAWTPTGSWNVNTTYSGLYRRVGDTLEMTVKVLMAGAPNAANLSVNLPPGLTIDAAKLAEVGGGEPIGRGTYSRSGVGDFNDLFIGAAGGATSVGVYYGLVTATSASAPQLLNALVSDSAPNAPAINDIYIFSCRVPISGWSSTIEFSQDIDNRVVAARYYLSSNTAFSSAPLDFDTKDYDTHSAGASAGGAFTYTCQVSGFYKITATVQATTATQCSITAVKNGANSYYLTQTHSTTNVISTGSTTIKCVVGDTIQIVNDNNVTYIGSAAGNTAIVIEKLPGNPVIAASEDVSLRYALPSGSVIPNGAYTIVAMSSKDFDTHSCYNPATGIFTSPIAAKWKITATLNIGLSAAGTTRVMSVRKNGGAQDRYLNQIPPSLNNSMMVGSTIYRLLPGETLAVELYQDTGGNLEPAVNGVNGTYLEIEKVGNY
jgi:hypothetical protein